ncbi:MULTISPECIES: antibiotic biosynthesis monooxygenase [Methylobacterium]|uniref:antibiotic biosynthesis monooxygenase n=1 Tax=Methylobacterium TaxID=407 RepID=UPI0011C7F152|nr:MULTISPECIES: antibiotic biosynthesis monooxygenase [Methylobacterium]TXN23757.1 antibiotic biosynthesis monooxygenase [Methylobacterium sp. WL9]
MTFVLIIHDVADYDAWKTVFDEAAALRRDAGEISYRVLSDDTDPNRVVHFSRWRSLAEARAFFSFERLVEIRERAGVASPDFLYLNQRASGVLG